VIDAYKGGRLGMLLAPPTALKRIQSDAKDIYAITDVAPAPLGPTGIADGGWLIHFRHSRRREEGRAARHRQIRPAT
jgi:putative chitobiose transport system substrate-binding protein